MLFHLHFYSPDWIRAEEEYCRDFGFRVVARHGMNGERWGSEVGRDAIAAQGGKVRLIDLAAGSVNFILAPTSPERAPFMEHVGIVLSEESVARSLERTADLGWAITDRGGRRVFVHTPYGFRVELMSRVVWESRWAGAAARPSLAEVVLAHPDPAAAAKKLAYLLDCSTSTLPDGDADAELVGPVASQQRSVAVEGPGVCLRFQTGPGRSGPLVGYRLAGLTQSRTEDPCGALVWGS